jgi:hypothetical protein
MVMKREMRGERERGERDRGRVVGYKVMRIAGVFAGGSWNDES